MFILLRFKMDFSISLIVFVTLNLFLSMIAVFKLIDGIKNERFHTTLAFVFPLVFWALNIFFCFWFYDFARQ